MKLHKLSGDSWRNGVPLANLPYTYVIRKNGREFWRFRKGSLHTALPGSPGDEQFHARYADLLGQASRVPPIIDERSVAGLVRAYRTSAEFRLLRAPTQLDYERTLALIITELGDQPYRLVTTKMVKFVRDDYAATPRKAHKIKQMVSRLYTWAAEDGRVRAGHNPAADFKRLKVRENTITPWSNAEVALFLVHAPPHLRTAVSLLLFTGQRCEDVAQMEWTAYQGEFMRVRQSKTGEPIEIACHRDLRALLEPVAIRRGKICRNAIGKVYTSNALRKAIADQCDKIEGFPPGRSPHGLRYAAAGCLEEAGCTVGQIISILGHRSYQMAVKYLTARRDSSAAIRKMELSA